MDWGQVERFVPGQSFQERERFFSRQVRSETAQARKQRVADAAVQERPQQDIQQMNPTVAAALRVHGGSGLLAKCTQVADVRSPRRSVKHVFWRPPATQMAAARVFRNRNLVCVEAESRTLALGSIVVPSLA